MSPLKRIALWSALLCACTPAGADTVLVADFHAGGDALSLGLPYLVARTLNRVPGLQAILPEAPPARLASLLYDPKGLPDFEAASRLRLGAGAGRVLLARAVPSGASGASTITFYLLAGTAGPRPEAFSAEIAEEACIPALAEWTAAKVDPASAGNHAPAVAPDLLPPFSRALRLLREGDAEGAWRALLAAADASPRNADARCLLGRAAAGSRKPYAALRLFNEAANLDPSFALPPYREGLLWLSLGRPTLAESAFDRAARIQPSFFEALLESGTLKTGSGDFAAAEGALRRAAAMRPESAEARYRLAECLAHAGKESEARRFLAGPVGGNLQHGPTRVLRGQFCFQAGEYAAAEAELRQAVRLMPESVKAHRMLGEALHRQGMHAEAAREFDRAARLEEKAR